MYRLKATARHTFVLADAGFSKPRVTVQLPGTVLQRANPFVFKHIQHLKSSSHFDDNSIGPCVVMATPSMLQVCGS